MAEKTYNPFQHAENYNKTFFNYGNKFLKDAPTIIVLVVFPWYNNLITDFADFNRIFYRAITRRFFCQYRYSTTKFNTFNSSFTGEQTLYEMSRYLSAIIFLEDNTILSISPDSMNVKSFIYFNPNAVNPVSDLPIWEDFEFCKIIENFRFDNY